MSEPDQQQREYGVLEALRHPVISLHLFIGIAGLIIFHTRMISRANNEGSLIAVLIGALGLIFRWTISPVLFLIILTYLLIDPNFRGLLLQDWQYSYRTDMYSNVLLCASILTYLIAQYRVLGFVHQSMPFDPPARRKGQPEPAIPRRPVELVGDREPITAVALGLGAVAFGVAAWSFVAWYERSQHLARAWGIQLPFARAMLLLWMVVTVALLTNVVFRYISLRRMNRQQARLMLQDMFWQETRREQERIHRWRNWAQSKQ